MDARYKVRVDANRAGEATLELRLPDTELRGRVVDEAGQPVVRASVQVESHEFTLDGFTDERGHFAFRGLPTTELALRAQGLLGGEAAETAEHFLSLPTGSRRDALELVLRPLPGLTGRVMGPRGPIAGAAVRIGSSHPGALPSSAVLTDAEGRFRAAVRPPRAGLYAVVAAPGVGFDAVPLSTDPAPPGGGVLVSLGETTGELQVSFPEVSAETSEQLRVVALKDGFEVGWPQLLQWALGQGQRPPRPGGEVRVPGVAAGEWSLCLVVLPTAPAFGRAFDWRPFARCTTGVLAAGHRLTLALPSPPRPTLESN